MKIHFYINYTFPYGMAAVKRILCYSKGLIAEGHKIDVLICQKCFEKGEQDKLPEEGFYNGILYKYVCGKYKKVNKLMRGLDYMIVDYVRSFFYALKNVHRDEIVYVYFYPIFLQILILLAAKIKGAKILKEICEHPSALGNVNSKWHKFSKWLEYRFVMSQYDGFIVISHDLNKFVERYKSNRAKSIIVPILVENPLENQDISRLQNEYKVPYIIHTGTMLEQKDSISKILRAFSRLKKEINTDCRLVFTGPQANSNCKYIPLIKELNIENDVDLLGMVSNEQIVSLQHFAAMTVIYKSDNLQTRNCFPTKLGEMLICGVPVITTTIGDANLYLKNEESAFIFEPNDETMLVQYMHFILNNPIEANEIGMNGRNVAIKYFNPIYQGKRLSKFCNKLLNKDINGKS